MRTQNRVTRGRYHGGDRRGLTVRQPVLVKEVRFTFSNLPGLAWHEPVGRIVDLARLCEEVGFDRFGVSDWRFMSDCLVTMTACLQATDRLRIQAQVTDPYVRHPTLTACAIATMDDLAPGRGILGLL